MSHRPRLETLRQETAAAFQQAVDLKARWAQLETDQHAVYRVRARARSALAHPAQRFEPQVQLSRLHGATFEQERISDAVARSFLDGTLDDEDAFVRQYRELRRVWHQRALRSEAWSANRVRWE